MILIGQFTKFVQSKLLFSTKFYFSRFWAGLRVSRNVSAVIAGTVPSVIVLCMKSSNYELDASNVASIPALWLDEAAWTSDSEEYIPSEDDVSDTLKREEREFEASLQRYSVYYMFSCILEVQNGPFHERRLF